MGSVFNVTLDVSEHYLLFRSTFNVRSRENALREQDGKLYG